MIYLHYWESVRNKYTFCISYSSWQSTLMAPGALIRAHQIVFPFIFLKLALDAVLLQFECLFCCIAINIIHITIIT